MTHAFAQESVNTINTQSTVLDVEVLRSWLSNLMPEQTVANKIVSSARRNGVDETLALNIACVESQFKANAKNPLSTAGGVYQWLDGSWAQYAKLYWGNSQVNKLNATDNIELSIIVIREVGTADWNASKDTGYGGGWNHHPYERGLCDVYL